MGFTCHVGWWPGGQRGGKEAPYLFWFVKEPLLMDEINFTKKSFKVGSRWRLLICYGDEDDDSMVIDLNRILFVGILWKCRLNTGLQRPDWYILE